MVVDSHENHISIYEQVSEMRKVQARSELNSTFYKSYLVEMSVNLESSPLSDMQYMRAQVRPSLSRE